MLETIYTTLGYPSNKKFGFSITKISVLIKSNIFYGAKVKNPLIFSNLFYFNLMGFYKEFIMGFRID